MSRQQFSLLRLRCRSTAMSCGVGRGASSDYFWAVFLPLGELPYYAVMQYACQDALYGGAAKGHKQLSLQVVQEVESLLGQFFFLKTTADAFEDQQRSSAMRVPRNSKEAPVRN